jgi:hypothetical protein
MPMFAANYFHDGYTQCGFIAAVPLVHGALRFTYRPALVEERSQLGDAARQLRSQLYDRHAAAFTAHKIVEWDLADSRGRAVPVSAEALLRLQPDLFVRLHKIVAGWMATDVDPAWPRDTKDRALEDQLESALTGRSVGEVRQERDEKNC